jgi:hypothetical protein
VRSWAIFGSIDIHASQSVYSDETIYKKGETLTSTRACGSIEGTKQHYSQCVSWHCRQIPSLGPKEALVLSTVVAEIVRRCFVLIHAHYDTEVAFAGNCENSTYRYQLEETFTAIGKQLTIQVIFEIILI